MRNHDGKSSAMCYEVPRYASIYVIEVTVYYCYLIERMAIMFPCRRLHERSARLDRIECNITSEVPFSDATMTAVSSALPFTTDSPIGWQSLVHYITL